jgi:hypothetical protein
MYKPLTPYMCMLCFVRLNSEERARRQALKSPLEPNEVGVGDTLVAVNGQDITHAKDGQQTIDFIARAPRPLALKFQRNEPPPPGLVGGYGGATTPPRHHQSMVRARQAL